MKELKQLKFAEPLPGLIRSGSKTTTWRIDDNKEIARGDILSLCDASGKEFLQAKVVKTRETKFGSLATSDWEGHERFNDEAEMYKTYSRYYNIEVGPETELKIIKFKTIDD